MEMTQRTRRQVKASLKSQQPLCGDCVGLKCEKLISDSKQVCSKLGKTATSKPCPHFIADTKPLQPILKRDAFDTLSRLFQEIPKDALRNVASLLYNEKKTRAAGYFFGQKVYVRYRGAANADYLSNFMIARVMSVNSEFIRLTSQDGKCNLTFMKKTCQDVILSVDEFDELRKKMVAKGRLVDPDVTKLIAKKYRAEEEYELNMTSESAGGQITTIDTVFKENKVPRKKQKKHVDLVDLVNGLMAGHTDVDEKSRKYKTAAPKRGKAASDGTGYQRIDVSGD
ncbi:hypothetical protein D3C85_370180 [compost metagenome]